MQTLIVTFLLAGLDDAYCEQAAASAPMFAAVPGLFGKTWLANAETNTSGGVYLFADRPSLDAYLNSAIVRSLRASPHFQNDAIRAFGTVAPATRTARGATALAPAAALAPSAQLAGAGIGGR